MQTKHKMKQWSAAPVTANGELFLCSWEDVCRHAEHFTFIYRFPQFFFFSPICFLSSFLCPLFCSSHPLPSHDSPKVFRQDWKQSQSTMKIVKFSVARQFSKHGYFSLKLCEGHMAYVYASAVQGRKDFSAVLVDPKVTEKTCWHDILERRT